MNHKMQQKYIYEHTNFQNFLFLWGYTIEPPCGRGDPLPDPPSARPAAVRGRYATDRSSCACLSPTFKNVPTPLDTTDVKSLMNNHDLFKIRFDNIIIKPQKRAKNSMSRT
jgi:hypothetical protein